MRISRLGKIEARLIKAGIDPSDLAELIRIRIVDSFEPMVRAMAEEALRSEIEGLTLVSRVRSKINRD